MNNRNNRHNRSKSTDLNNMNNKDKKAFMIIPGIVILLFLICSIFITKTVINSTANYIKTTATVQSTHKGSKQETIKTKNRLHTKHRTVTYNYATITYKDTNNNAYTINKEYSMTSLKQGDKMTIYYNPDNPEKLKPEMSIFYIMDSIGVIFLLIYLCVICKFIIKSKK